MPSRPTASCSFRGCPATDANGDLVGGDDTAAQCAQVLLEPRADPRKLRLRPRRRREGQRLPHRRRRPAADQPPAPGVLRRLPPGEHVLGVRELPVPGMKVEIEAVALLARALPSRPAGGADRHAAHPTRGLATPRGARNIKGQTPSVALRRAHRVGERADARDLDLGAIAGRQREVVGRHDAGAGDQHRAVGTGFSRSSSRPVPRGGCIALPVPSSLTSFAVALPGASRSRAARPDRRHEHRRPDRAARRESLACGRYSGFSPSMSRAVTSLPTVTRRSSRRPRAPARAPARERSRSTRARTPTGASGPTVRRQPAP